MQGMGHVGRGQGRTARVVRQQAGMDQMKSRARVETQRHILGQRISACLVVVMLVTVFLIVPAFGQDGEEDESPATVGPITGAQTMWSIANENRPDTRASIPQFMLAFVERNPDAFIAGNVNLLREGVILEVPSVEEALAIPSDEAQRRLDEQMAWFSDLSREERMALRETAESELPTVIEDPEPAVEPDEVAPDPEAVLEPEEAIVEPEPEPEPEVPEILEPEAAPDPEPLDVVPEPAPAPEADVTIVDEVPEPDPVFDPAEEPTPAEAEPELLPESPESIPDPDPRLTPEEDPLPETDPAPREAEVDSPPASAPPIAPGPGPEPGWMDRVSWWMWAMAALVLLLGLLLILQIIGRRREAAMIESELPADSSAQATTASPAAVAAIATDRLDSVEEEAPEASGDDAGDNAAQSDDDPDSAWANFEESVMGSEPDVEAPTAVLDGAHPAEQADEKVSDEKEPEFDWLELDDAQASGPDAAVSGAESGADLMREPQPPEPESATAEEDRDPNEGSSPEPEEEFDLAEFSRIPPDTDQKLDEPDEPEAQSEEPEFDLTNFDFDDTMTGDEDQTVVQDESPVDDDIDDAVPERSGKGLDDLDEIMSRDLQGAGLMDEDEEEERTEIAPPDVSDSPADKVGEVDESSANESQDRDETTSEAPRLNDQEAEVMIDLARLTADGGDEPYARDLLAEVIRDGSKKMAEEARKLRESLG